MNVRRSTAALSVSVIAMLLSGCLSIETIIRFDDRESGSIEMRYDIDEEYVAEGAVDGPSGVLPLPVSETELKRSASAIDGISLERYETASSGGRYNVRAEFRFTSLDALNRFYAGVAGADDSDAERPIRFDGDRYEQLLFTGFDEPVGDEEREFLELLIGEERLAFRVVLPQSVVAADIGEREGGREVYVELSGEDLYDTVEPVHWRIDME